MTESLVRSDTLVDAETRRRATQTSAVIDLSRPLWIPQSFASQWLSAHSPWEDIDAKVMGVERTVMEHTKDHLRFVNKHVHQDLEYWYEGWMTQPYEVNAEIQVVFKRSPTAFGVMVEKLQEDRGALFYRLTWRIVPVGPSARLKYVFVSRALRTSLLKQTEETLTSLKRAWEETSKVVH